MLATLPRMANPYQVAAERLDPDSDRARLDREREAAMADVRVFARHARIRDEDGAEVAVGVGGWVWQFALLGLWVMTKLSVVLKARQLGVSWLAAIYVLWLAIRKPGQVALLISRNQDDAEKLLEKVAYVWEHLPAWRPRAIVNARSIRFPTLGSEIQAMPATENVGRSRTANVVVLDEHGFQPFARKTLLAVQAAAEKGQVLSISSGNGRGALHSQLFVESKGGSPLSATQLPDSSPLPLRVTATVGPNGWRGIFVPYNARPERDAAWRIAERARSSEFSDAEFEQEYPRDDVEAIQTTGRPVFRPEDLRRHAEHIEAGTRGEPGLTLYREPIAGLMYLIGADVSEGLEKSDWCSAWVMERDSGEQVAMLRGRWSPDVYASRLDRLARHYGVMAEAKNRQPVILAVERNNHGHAVLLRLVQLAGVGAPYALYRARDKRIGWVTSTATRPVMVDQLEAAVRLDEIEVHDAGSIDQMATFSWGDDGKPEGQEGYFDDDVIAGAIAWQVRRRSFGRVLDVVKREAAAA